MIDKQYNRNSLVYALIKKYKLQDWTKFVGDMRRNGQHGCEIGHNEIHSTQHDNIELRALFKKDL